MSNAKKLWAKRFAKWILAPTIFLAFVFWIVTSSETFHDCVENYQYKEAQKTFQKNPSQVPVTFKACKSCLGETIHRNADSIIALFTVILGFATWLLYWATRALVKGAERASQRQLRAYISVVSGGMKIQNGLVLHISARFKNSGQTPMYRFTNHVRAGTRNLTQALGPFLPPTIPTKGSVSDIGPGTEFVLSDSVDLTNKPSVAALVLAGFRDGSCAAFLWGRMDYVDAFDVPRFMDFRFKVVDDGSGGWTLEGTDEGNKSD